MPLNKHVKDAIRQHLQVIIGNAEVLVPSLTGEEAESASDIAASGREIEEILRDPEKASRSVPKLAHEKKRGNPSEPRDLGRAIKLYEDFQDFEPQKVGAFAASVKIPAEVYRVGKGVHIAYHSKKWRDPADYIHDFEEGVNVHLTTGEQGGRPVKVPKYIREAQTLSRLGWLLECEWEEPGGEEVQAKGKKPAPEIYAIPSGKALVIVEGKRRVTMIIWGGRLGVEDRGIVH